MKIYKSILISLFLAAFFQWSHAVSRDSLVADYDFLVKAIEDTHPDPYTGFGGRPYFHEEAGRLRSVLSSDSAATVETLHGIAAKLISRLHDGHTFINVPAGASAASGSDSLLMVKFRYAADGLLISGISESDSALLGSRLTAINGIPTEEIAARVAEIYPCENRAGRYAFIADYYRPLSFYRKLVGKDCGTLMLELATPSGDTIVYCPSVVHADEWGNTARRNCPESEMFPSEQMEWRALDGTMFFKLASVMSRENFEYQYDNGWDYYNQLVYYYRMLKKDMPADTLEAIRSLPSMSETFMAMLGDMKARGLKKLVIDLRGNGGGWTPIVRPTLYMMYGDKFLDTDMSGKNYRRISDLYLKKINTTLEQLNAYNGSNLKTGDYTIYASDADSRPIEQRREDFLRTAFCSDSVREKLRALDGEALYTPEDVYVVTDAGTFSAAFHYAFFLKKMGATVAGETCSQAPNCFMEVTPFILPNSGLSGSISNSMQVFLPADDPLAHEFTPDKRLSYDDYRTYNFDYNVILRHILR